MTANKNVSFGFGTMRLPLLDPGDPTSFDFDRIQALFDRFLELGFRYFDTAYTYHGYEGEKAVRKTLVERHPRESFELTTKLPLRDFRDAEDMETIFNEQLQNCGVAYFDHYLLHNMGHNVFPRCVAYDAFGFVRKKKAEGKILDVGMSFHDTPELLEEILSRYGDCLDFVQLQVNYVDMDQANVQSRRCLEVAGKYHKPVTVMEPCKGGTLVRIPPEAEALLKACAPEASAASWALRFAAGQPGVIRVLSGMNSLEQVEENCAVFRELRPLSAEENAVAIVFDRRIVEVDFGHGIVHKENVAVFICERSAVHRKGRLALRRVSRHRLINHNRLIPARLITVFCVVIGGQVNIVERHGIFALDHNPLRGC